MFQTSVFVQHLNNNRVAYVGPWLGGLTQLVDLDVSQVRSCISVHIRTIFVIG